VTLVLSTVHIDTSVAGQEVNLVIS
jgi:hypothetical protein